MSHDDASVSAVSFTDRIQPSREEVEILNQIILQAQDDPAATQSPRDALFKALAQVLEEQSLDVLEDRVFVPILMRVIANDSAGDLRSKFENVLQGYNIALEYGDEDDNNGERLRLDDDDKLMKPEEISESHVVGLAQPHRSDRLSSKRSFDEFNHDEYMEHPSQQILDAMRRAERHDQRTLLRQALLVFKQPDRNLTGMERYADARYKKQLQSKVIAQWKGVLVEQDTDIRYADDQYNVKSKRRCLRIMLDASHQQRIKAMDEQRLRGKSLYSMTLATRESQTVRRLDAKLKLRYLRMVIERLRTSQNQQLHLESILRQRQAYTDSQLKQPAMDIMLHLTQNAQTMSVDADQHYQKHQKNKFVVRWRARCRDIRETEIAADQLHTFFLMRKYLNKLRDAAQAKINRRLVLGKWTFSRWRSFVYHSKHDRYDLHYRIIRKSVKMRLARAELSAWRTEASRVQQLDEVAIAYRQHKDRQFAHSLVVNWYKKSMNLARMEEIADRRVDGLDMKHCMNIMSERMIQTIQMQEVADRFRILHDQQVASKSLRRTALKLFEIRRRQEDADAFRSRQDKKTLRLNLDRIRNALAHHRGEGPLHLPPATPARRRAEELSRLSTTPLYTPAQRISNFSARLKDDNTSIAIKRFADSLTEETEEDG